MRVSVKKLVCVTMIFAMFCSALVIQEKTGEAASTYKLTGYKSYDQVVKQLPEDDSMYSFGVTYAKSKLKTKFGTKNVLACRTLGSDPSASTTKLFVKKGNKIYNYQEFPGYIKYRSKDCKYIIVSAVPGSIDVYKYNKSKGKYKVVTRDFLEESSETVFKKFVKKYNCPVELKYKDYSVA